MKTWEMIKELTENPEKKFISKASFQIQAISVNGSIGFNDVSNDRFVHSVSASVEWEEIKQPVTFMEAFNALRHHSKDIRCRLDKELHHFTGDYQADHLFSEELIAKGKWYIED